MNKLKDSTSPYLLQHADNPVDWYPWSEEALQAARAEDKPIFLSVGYAACHWCHVMAHESFEDDETAALMNKHFINIKVDREERPDIDALYMDAVVAMTGQGGWPMSVFMTPDGKPFYGGTYFPPVPRYNIPSFRNLLEEIARLWKEDREGLTTKADQFAAHLQESPVLIPASSGIDEQIFATAVETLFNRFDWTYGGWGSPPKFPQSPVLEFLLQLYDRKDDKLALEMAVITLHSMAKGGMYDLIGGGFHRYSVDQSWLVPHFEKMLYDNAMLIETYLKAWLVTNDPFFRKVAVESIDFINRDLRDQSGGYFSSLDADSEGEEGTYYLWSFEEIFEALGDERLAELATQALGITKAGNFEGKNIPTSSVAIEELALRRGSSLDEVSSELDTVIRMLLSHRSHRALPGLDDKVLTSWNGLTLKALSTAARVLGDNQYLQDARKLANFLMDEMFIDGKLMRSWRKGKANFTAYLEDHAALGIGLLELYQIDFDNRWYSAAAGQAEVILENFQDPDGGFFDTRHDHEQLIARPKGLQDSPIPSGNSMAAELLLKLAALTGESRHRDSAELAINAMQANAAKYPSAFGNWLCAADFALGPQLQLAILGDSQDPGFDDLLAVSNQAFLPRLVRASAPVGSEATPPLLNGREQINGQATAYLCQGFACKLPTTSAEELRRQIEETRVSTISGE